MNVKVFRYALLLSLCAVSFASLAGQDEVTPYTTKDGLLTLSFPSGWVIGDESDPKYKEALEKIRQNNPALAKHMSDQAKPSALTMYNFGDSPDDGVLENMNVKVNDANGLTVKMFPDVGKLVMQQLPVKGKGEYKVVDMPVGKTLTYSCTLEITNPEGQKVNMDMIGYLFLKGEKVFVVTFATGEGQMKDRKKEFETIFKSAKT